MLVLMFFHEVVMIRIFPRYEALSAGAAEHILSVGRRAVADRGRFDFVLAGGSTPRLSHEKLAERTRDDVEFRHRTHLYRGDERSVPPDDAWSNYHTTRCALLDRLDVPGGNVHGIEAQDANPQAARGRYEALFPPSPDLVLLGMGHDGHTAWLFSLSPALDERVKRLTISTAPHEPRGRITMTLAAITSARKVLMLVSGAKRAKALARVFSEEADAARTPAGLVHGATWFVDADAPRNWTQGRGLIEDAEYPLDLHRPAAVRHARLLRQHVRPHAEPRPAG